jgi:ferredoxin-NADP reductase
MTEDIKTMVFNILGDDELHFKAGQYVQVCYQLPWEKVLRAYSIASPSSECKSFSLDVQRVQGGLVSNYLHQLSVGAEIEISGPFGDMYLQNKHLDCPIVLVAGGVGLAPLRSILEQLREQSFPGPVWLFHGARSRSNLYGETIFRDLAAKYSNFSYQPALSRPLLEDGWLEHRGMIHERLERQPIEQAELAVAFVCGPSLMMQAVRKVLVAKGFTSDRILTDPFDF